MRGNTGNSGYVHAEDLALKSAASYFGEEMLRWLGIKEEVLRCAPTELVELEVRHMYQDFLFQMRSRIWYHFEFESDALTVEDLRRFREYEATTARKLGASVITYVICSSKVRKVRYFIREGINTYRVKVIRLKDADADRILEKLAKEKKNIRREDFFPLLLAPLMGGKSGKEERIRKSIRALRKAEGMFSKEEVQKMEAILYLLAMKFLTKDELERIKEEMAMTILGQMIWDDAMEKGIEKGRMEGERIGGERYSRLILILDKEGRQDQIIKIASDQEYRERLYQEYHI